jgi:hypothetical protein
MSTTLGYEGIAIIASCTQGVSDDEVGIGSTEVTGDARFLFDSVLRETPEVLGNQAGSSGSTPPQYPRRLFTDL